MVHSIATCISKLGVFVSSYYTKTAPLNFSHALSVLRENEFPESSTYESAIGWRLDPPGDFASMLNAYYLFLSKAIDLLFDGCSRDIDRISDRHSALDESSDARAVIIIRGYNLIEKLCSTRQSGIVAREYHNERLAILRYATKTVRKGNKYFARHYLTSWI